MSNQPVAAGQEVLVVDADDQVVKGLDRLLTRVGLIVTGTHDPVRARDQLLNKFYAVALVDADTPTPGGGIELLQFARDKSPLTSVVDHDRAQVLRDRGQGVPGRAPPTSC